MHALKFADFVLFLSTLSLRRATHKTGNNYIGYCDFYPRSPCGERRYSLRHSAQSRHFYPRSPCGERLWPGLLARPFFIISIHALLAESDEAVAMVRWTLPISIHALLAESDCAYLPMASSWYTFLSTLSLRRATIPGIIRRPESTYFYPRSPCGERPRFMGASYGRTAISIHALLAESDPSLVHPRQLRVTQFLSTLSLRRATHRVGIAEINLTFLSTLSLRRATKRAIQRLSTSRFLSTLSLRRATC